MIRLLVNLLEALLQMGGADAVYYGTQVRGVSNAKAKRELNFRPRPLEWMVHTAVAHISQPTYKLLYRRSKGST